MANKKRRFLPTVNTPTDKAGPARRVRKLDPALVAIARDREAQRSKEK